MTHWIEKAITWAERIPLDISLLLMRFGVGLIFFRSGQTKVEGFTVTDSTFFLFESEYALPLIPPVPAAYAATIAEHALPVLLFLGLATRFGALGLLGMTAVIQTFVYPNLWYDHLFWAAALILLISRGGGRFSLDHVIRRQRASATIMA